MAASSAPTPVTPVQLALDAEALLSSTTQQPAASTAAAVIAQQQRALAAALRKNLRPSAPGPLVVIYDIEGTTTPLPFVTAALFPYSAEHMDAFVDVNITDEVLEAAAAADAGSDDKMVRIAADALTHYRTTAASPVAPLETPSAQRDAIKLVMHAAIKDNLKVPFLKTAQGMIWKHGYESGALCGRLFDDAATAIRQLGHSREEGGGVFTPSLVSQHIYSSGSIAAQLLLFRHSSHGDLTPALAGYHDPTVVGSKLEPASYVNLKRRIASSVVAHESLGAGEGAMSAASLGLSKLASSSSSSSSNDDHEQLLKGIVFVTDSLAELKAANAAAGIVGVLSVRPLNAPLPRDQAEFAAAVGGEAAAAGLASVVSFDQLVQAIAEVCGGPADAADLHFALARDAVADLAPKADNDRKSFT